MQDYHKASRQEWLAEVQDEFIRVRFWKCLAVGLSACIAVAFIIATIR